MAWIYLITNDINGKQYVGKTYYENIQKRWKEHLREYTKIRSEKRPLYDAMNKYGIEHFHIKEIEYVPPEVNLEEREIYWIAQYDTYNNGYNATLGGDGIRRLDYNELIKAYQELGTLKAVSDKYQCDIRHLSNILKSFNIIVHTQQEINQKLYGKKINQYDLQGKYIKTFSSAWEALTEVSPRTKSGGGVSHITDVCKGKRKTAYGYIWRYANK